MHYGICASGTSKIYWMSNEKKFLQWIWSCWCQRPDCICLTHGSNYPVNTEPNYRNPQNQETMSLLSKYRICMGENNLFCILRKWKDLDKIAQSNSVRLCISSFLCGPEPIYGHVMDCIRLRVVPHFSSGIVERAKRERAWKSPHARKGDTRRGERKMRDYS